MSALTWICLKHSEVTAYGTPCPKCAAEKKPNGGISLAEEKQRDRIADVRGVIDDYLEAKGR